LAQEEESLPMQLKALSSISGTTKKKKAMKILVKYRKIKNFINCWKNGPVMVENSLEISQNVKP
jgi:hypothetical protein